MTAAVAIVMCSEQVFDDEEIEHAGPEHWRLLVDEPLGCGLVRVGEVVETTEIILWS